MDQSLKHLVPPYVERRKRDVVRIREALGNGDFATIQTIGHQIRGNASNLGFDELGAIGARLETAALAADAVLITSLSLEIETFVTNLKVD